MTVAWESLLEAALLDPRVSHGVNLGLSRADPGEKQGSTLVDAKADVNCLTPGLAQGSTSQPSMTPSNCIGFHEVKYFIPPWWVAS